MASMISLDGKVAIVTGASRGQGEAEARMFAQHGAAVLVCDLLEDEGRVVSDSIRESGGVAEFIRHDVSSKTSWEQVITYVETWKGRLDILVNNAGAINRTTIEDTDLANWEKIIGVNLTSAFLGIKEATPLMRKSGGGSIVNISSNSAFFGHNDPAYSSSKWGLRGLTRCAAMEFVKDNIRVNSVCPGLILTGLNEHEAHLTPMINMTPMGRSGQPEEIAQLVLFLASEASSFITGEDFTADGGFNAGAAYRRVCEESKAN